MTEFEVPKALKGLNPVFIPEGTRMNVVLNRTVVNIKWRFYLCGSQSQIELYHVSWWYFKTLVIDLIGQSSRDQDISPL